MARIMNDTLQEPPKYNELTYISSLVCIKLILDNHVEKYFNQGYAIVCVQPLSNMAYTCKAFEFRD
jgi:hypothetical protein